MTATAEASAPHERSCDGKPATFHVERALSLIDRAYREERWEDPTPVQGSERRALREHKHCVRDAELRERIEERREEVAEAFGDYREYRLIAPYPGPGDTWWSIPWSIIYCETRANPGSWTITAPDGGLGPYQLTGWPVPWPVTSFEDQLAHHRMARYLWTTYGSSQWVCA